MPKAEWGEKHLCQSCGARFYDLKKKPPVCPKCETEVQPPKSTRRQAATPAPEKAVVAPVAAPKEAAVDETADEEEEDDALIDDESEDDALIADDDEDEDEDVPGVIVPFDGDSDEKE